MLRQGVEQAIYGPAVQKIVDEINLHKTALEQIDGATTVVKTQPAMNAAVKEAFAWLQALSLKPRFKALLKHLWLQAS